MLPFFVYNFYPVARLKSCILLQKDSIIGFNLVVIFCAMCELNEFSFTIRANEDWRKWSINGVMMHSYGLVIYKDSS